jgi:hypothetical protein
MLNFGLRAHLGLQNLHEIGSVHKLFKFHVVKFEVFNLIVNQCETKGNL